MAYFANLEPELFAEFEVTTKVSEILIRDAAAAFRRVDIYDHVLATLLAPGQLTSRQVREIETPRETAQKGYQRALEVLRLLQASRTPVVLWAMGPTRSRRQGGTTGGRGGAR